MKTRLLLFAAFLVAAGACTRQKAELGTSENPIKFFFVPSVESQILEESAMDLKAYLEKVTPYSFQVSVPTSYIAVVEAFGSKRADVASLNTYGYVLAQKKYGVDIGLTVERNGETTYRSAIIVRKDSGIKKLSDLNDKKVAFVDPTSTSGYLLPMKLFKDNDVKPKEVVFGQKHDNVVSMVYQKQVDAGAIYYSPKHKGKIQDARNLVYTQYPDVEEKVHVLALSRSLPNDGIVFRTGLPKEMKNKIESALIDYIETARGKEAFEKTFAITAFVRADISDYEKARKLIEEINPSALK